MSDEEEYQPIAFGRKREPKETTRSQPERLAAPIQQALDREDGVEFETEQDMLDRYGAPDAGTGHIAGPAPAANMIDPVTGKAYRQGDKLPRNIEAEAGLLGALLIDNRFVDRVRANLSKDDFYEPIHGAIYEAILMVVDQGKLANPVTMKPIVGKWEMLQPLGGASYLAQLTGSGAAVIGAVDFAEQIVDLSRRRKLLAVIDEADVQLNEAFDDNRIESVVGRIDAALMEAVAGTEKTRETFIGDAVMPTIEAAEGRVEPSGILISGFIDWNAICGRMPGATTIYLGGRPSMGKTAVAVAVAKGAASVATPGPDGADEYLNGVVFYSLETSKDVIGRRALADEMYEPGLTSGYEALQKGGAALNTDDWRAIAAAKERLDRYPLILDDPDVLYVENLASDLRRKQRKLERMGKKLVLGVIDYLALMGTLGKFSNEEARVSHISKTIKAASKKTGIPLIVLCQLSRAVEQRDNKRPMLADLRTSGSLEQDADVVIFVYRDQYYLERAEPPKDQATKHAEWLSQMGAAENRVEVYAAKKKEGALVKREGYFIAAHQAIRPSSFRMGGDLFSIYDPE